MPPFTQSKKSDSLFCFGHIKGKSTVKNEFEVNQKSESLFHKELIAHVTLYLKTTFYPVTLYLKTTFYPVTLYLKSDLLQSLFFKERIPILSQRGKELNKFCPPISSEDLCLFFCLYSFSMHGYLLDLLSLTPSMILSQDGCLCLILLLPYGPKYPRQLPAVQGPVLILLDITYILS